MIFARSLDGGSRSEYVEQSGRSELHRTIPIDWNGCRQFPPLPPVREHPRLFFGKSEISRLVVRFTHSDIRESLMKVLEVTYKHFSEYSTKVQTLSHNERLNPTYGTIREFFKADDGRNTAFVGAYIYGFIRGDFALLESVKNIVVFYSKIVINSKKIAIEEELLETPFSFWHHSDWDVSSAWLTGGSSIALLYDLLYADMSQQEQDVVRKSIALSCRGRRSWGMSYPGRKIQSNWATYHGDLYVMEAAIQDEEGFDREVYTLFEDLFANYMNFAIYDSGHPVEDAYALNLAFREGSMAFLAMARRGFNLFNHPRKYRFLQCLQTLAREEFAFADVAE